MESQRIFEKFILKTLMICLVKETLSCARVGEASSRPGRVLTVQGLNKLESTSVCLIYLDSDAEPQMCHFSSPRLCVSSFHRQGASFLSAG